MTELTVCTEQHNQTGFFAIRFSRQLQQNNKSPNQRLKEGCESAVLLYQPLNRAVLVASVTGGVVRHIVAFKAQKASTKNVKMTNHDLRSYYNDESDSTLLELSIKLSKIATRNTLIPVPPLAALFYIASESGNLEKAKSFLDDLAAGYGKGVRSPVRKLLHTLTEIRVANRNKVMPDVMSILLARTWENYKEGKASTKRDMHIDSASFMPDLTK